jgi:hypothetical protein
MEMKVGLTYACMNLKKLGRILKKKRLLPTNPTPFAQYILSVLIRINKKRKVVLCLLA